jgi:hypothetical protein
MKEHQHPMNPQGFIHVIDTRAPRYNLVEKPITEERAIELKMAKIRAAEEALREAIEAPLDTHEMEFVRVTEEDFKLFSNPAYYESDLIEHPMTLHQLLLAEQDNLNFDSSIPTKKFQFLSDALRTKIKVAL